MRNLTKLLLVMSLMYSASNAVAESGGFTVPDPIQNSTTNSQSTQQPTTAQQGQTSGLVQGGVSSAIAGEGSAPQLSSSTGSQDRKNNDNQAASQSNSGAAAAATAGGILTGIGVPMLLSPDIPTQVAGAMLLADAALEFAQMGADQGAAGQNSQHAQQISQPTDSGSEQQAPVTPPPLDPATQNALQAAGINPQQFAQQIQSGNVTPQDLLSQYAGNPTPSADQQKAGEDMAATALAANTPNAIDPSKRLQFDDANLSQTTGDAPKSASTGMPMLTGNPPAPSAATADASGSNASGRSAAPKGALDSQNPLASQLGLPGVDDTAIKSLMSTMPAAATNPWATRGFITQALAQSGIAVPPKGENIFQRAHHQYRNFGRWRKSSKVALNDVALANTLLKR